MGVSVCVGCGCPVCAEGVVGVPVCACVYIGCECAFMCLCA